MIYFTGNQFQFPAPGPKWGKTSLRPTHTPKEIHGNHRNVTHNFKLTPTSSRPPFSTREQTQSHHTHGDDDGAPPCNLLKYVSTFFFNARWVLLKNFLASAPANLSLRRNPTNRDETDSREKSSHFGPHHRIQPGTGGRHVEGSALLFAGFNVLSYASILGRTFIEGDLCSHIEASSMNCS